ncbi:unnamed protein product, partial [Discosporangium mesarthrocarpum]
MLRVEEGEAPAEKLMPHISQEMENPQNPRGANTGQDQFHGHIEIPNLVMSLSEDGLKSIDDSSDSEQSLRTANPADGARAGLEGVGVEVGAAGNNSEGMAATVPMAKVESTVEKEKARGRGMARATCQEEEGEQEGAEPEAKAPKTEVELDAGPKGPPPRPSSRRPVPRDAGSEGGGDGAGASVRYPMAVGPTPNSSVAAFNQGGLRVAGHPRKSTKPSSAAAGDGVLRPMNGERGGGAEGSGVYPVFDDHVEAISLAGRGPSQGQRGRGETIVAAAATGEKW